MTENFTALTAVLPLTGANLLMHSRNAVAASFAQPDSKQTLLGNLEAFEAANAPSA